MTPKVIVHIDHLVAPGMSRSELARLPDALASALREAMANGADLASLGEHGDRSRLSVTLAPSATPGGQLTSLGDAIAGAIVRPATSAAPAPRHRRPPR